VKTFWEIEAKFHTFLTLAVDGSGQYFGSALLLMKGDVVPVEAETGWAPGAVASP
jgi:hypothetical protein